MLNVAKLKATAPIRKTAVEEKKIRIVGGIYKLASGRVEFLA